MANTTDNSDPRAWILCFMNFDGEVTLLDSNDCPEQMFYYVESNKKMVDLKHFSVLSMKDIHKQGGYLSGLYIIPGKDNASDGFYFMNYFDIFNMKKLFAKMGVDSDVPTIFHKIPSYAVRIKNIKHKGV